ncbi:MAG: hypothetical protein EHM18_18560 [Acidobacteria bacterium]|nr:MAG: hypothetical protein EHM18_18560 [Acidobacteriota bacterium]
MPELLALRRPVQQEIQARLLGNLDALGLVLADSPAEVLPMEAGWYALIRLPRVRSEDEWVVDLLQKTGTLVHPGYFYDLQDEPFAVVSLLPSPPVFEEGIQALAGLL